MTTASGTPTAMESPKPASVSQRVAQVCPGRWTRCSHAAPTISDGAGRTNTGTLKRRTATSQRTSKATSAAAGIRYSAPRAGPLENSEAGFAPLPNLPPGEDCAGEAGARTASITSRGVFSDTLLAYRAGEVTAAEDEVSDLVGMLAVLGHRLRRHRAGAGQLEIGRASCRE